MMIMNKTWNYFSISLNINSFDLKDNNMDNPPLASPEKKTIADKVLERIIDIAVPTLCLLICWIYFPPRLSFLTDSFRPEPQRPSSSRPVWIVFHPWVASSPVAAAPRHRGERRQFPSASTSPSEIERSQCRVAAETPGFCFLGFIFPPRRRGTK